MVGDGVVLLLSVSAALTVVGIVISRKVGGNGGIVVICAVALLILLMCFVLFNLPQHSSSAAEKEEHLRVIDNVEVFVDHGLWLRVGMVLIALVGAMMAAGVMLLHCTDTHFASPLPARKQT